jgi:hypothetical protein
LTRPAREVRASRGSGISDGGSSDLIGALRRISYEPERQGRREEKFMNSLVGRGGWLAVVALLAALVPVNVAFGDGVYIPRPAYPTLPAIPAQSAVIIYKNGTETLIVESAFESKSPDVAWILPLPAAPTDLKLLEAGAIKSTAFSLRPHIVHDLHGLDSFFLLLGLMFLPFALAIIYIRDRGVRRETMRWTVVVEMMLGCLTGLLLPALSSTRAPLGLPGVTVSSINRLGDADFAVLNATTPDAIDAWLTGQGLRPLDAAAKPIVADYIARHWCFVVGMLHNDGMGTAASRPLMATFRVAAPVFPMKLTALANTTTHVELCVFAGDEAQAAGFHCVVADTVHLEAAGQTWDGKTSLSEYYAAEHTAMALGHPDLVPLLWDQCTATKLSADLSPTEMNEDVAIELQPLYVHQDRFFSSLTRRQIAIAVVIGGVDLFLMLAAIFGYGGQRPSAGQQKVLNGFIPVVVGLAATVWWVLPTAPVYIDNGVARRFLFYEPEAVKQYAKAGHDVRGLTPDQLAAIMGSWEPNFVKTNPYTGQPVIAECSPGNYAVRTVDDKTYFCLYDENGVERRVAVP